MGTSHVPGLGEGIKTIKVNRKLAHSSRGPLHTYPMPVWLEQWPNSKGLVIQGTPKSSASLAWHLTCKSSEWCLAYSRCSPVSTTIITLPPPHARHSNWFAPWTLDKPHVLSHLGHVDPVLASWNPLPQSLVSVWPLSRCTHTCS